VDRQLSERSDQQPADPLVDVAGLVRVLLAFGVVPERGVGLGEHLVDLGGLGRSGAEQELPEQLPADLDVRGRFQCPPGRGRVRAAQFEEVEVLLLPGPGQPLLEPTGDPADQRRPEQRPGFPGLPGVECEHGVQVHVAGGDVHDRDPVPR